MWMKSVASVGTSVTEGRKCQEHIDAPFIADPLVSDDGTHH